MDRTSVESDDVDDAFRNPVTDGIIVKEIAPVCTKSAVRMPTKVIRLFMNDGTLDSIEKQIIPKEIKKSYCANLKAQKTDLVVNINGGRQISFNGSLQTKHIKDEGYFEHTIIITSHDVFQNSVCYGKLNLRNGDGLLSVNWEDCTIKSHHEVLHLLNSAFNNATSEDGNMFALEYIRPNEDSIMEGRYNIRLGNELSITPVSDISLTKRGEWKHSNMKYVTCFKNKGNRTYMQTIDDNVVFTDIITRVAGIGLEEFHRAHFKEDKLLDEDKLFYYKRFFAEMKNKYLYVSSKGQLELNNTFSAFRMKHEVDDGYSTMEYRDKLLSINISQEGVFMIDKLKIGRHIPMECRFSYEKVTCDHSSV